VAPLLAYLYPYLRDKPHLLRVVSSLPLSSISLSNAYSREDRTVPPRLPATRCCKWVKFHGIMQWNNDFLGLWLVVCLGFAKLLDPPIQSCIVNRYETGVAVNSPTSLSNREMWNSFVRYQVYKASSSLCIISCGESLFCVNCSDTLQKHQFAQGYYKN
jgi:hypothetical protein